MYLALETVDSSYLDRVKNGEGELYKPDSLDMAGIAGGNNNPQARPESKDQAENTTDSSTGASKIASSDADKSNDNSSVVSQEMPGEAANNGPPAFGDGGNLPFGGAGGNGPGGGMQADDAVSLIYSDDNESSYASIFDNSETKSDVEDHNRVIKAIKNLNEGTDLEQYVDIDSVLRYLAAHTAVVNLDSYSSNMGHNYYLYENDGQISILPWDYNMAFGGFQSHSANDVVNFPIDTPVSGVSMEDRPLISKLLEQPEYMQKYHQYLQQIIDGYFSEGQFEKRIDQIDALISSYVEKDPSALYTYEAYKTAVSELKELGTLRGESIQGQLDGTIPSTTQDQESAADKLIDASSVNLTALGGETGEKGGQDIGGNADESGGKTGGISALGGMDAQTMQKIMEIFGSAENNTLTEAQRTQLKDLGLTDAQISEMLQRGQSPSK